jgi:GrpB-like predicted nucleotidyltransferase (UPF0157 family)
MPEPIVIHNYDPRWPAVFEACRTRIASALGPLAQRIEHVGSTAVPHLPAKPIIDLIVVIPTRAELPAVIARLHQLGYEHKGDGGIAGREAFTAPPDAPAQHLYVCAADSTELARQVAFRDLLRAQTVTAQAYGDLKRSLAQRFRQDRAGYTEAKATFVEHHLAVNPRLPGA